MIMIMDYQHQIDTCAKIVRASSQMKTIARDDEESIVKAGISMIADHYVESLQLLSNYCGGNTNVPLEDELLQAISDIFQEINATLPVIPSERQMIRLFFLSRCIRLSTDSFDVRSGGEPD